jgi:hypothetical protein
MNPVKEENQTIKVEEAATADNQASHDLLGRRYD